MLPPKLKKGDHVRVIAPAHSFAESFTKDKRKLAEDRLGELGLTVSYGKYVDELDDFKTASVEKRVEDLHEAFADPNVQAIIPARGGSTSNQLLKYIDYDLIRKKPKILCGLSDITALSYAITAKTGLVTYYGPHYTTLGASRIVDYSLESMRNTFFSKANFKVHQSEYYCDSDWDREIIVNEGFWTINEGEAEGRCMGGNFLTTNFMLGNGYVPDIKDAILFMEENHVIDFRGVQNEIQAILNQPGGEKIRGLIIGRFQKETGMTRDLLMKMIKSKKELKNVPVIGNIDFGHTTPVLTLPVCGKLKFKAGKNDDVQLEITEH